MKKAFNILLYLSLLFLFIYLYRLDYFSFTGLKWNTSLIVVSTLLLWTGYYLSSLSWWNILRKHEINIGSSIATVSHGLSIFAKYIPGKIWVILGRAGYVARYGFSLKSCSFLSMKEQLLYVWLGLFISAIPMLFFYGLTLFTLFVLGILLFFTFFLYSKKFHFWLLSILSKITRKSWDIPFVSFRDNLNIIGLILVYWLVWLFAFYFFVRSFYPDAGFEIAFAFPLSVTLGLLAIVFPGGLGVREGIMVGYMTLGGIPVETATSISIYARLWFISGEIFIFLLALIIKAVTKKLPANNKAK
ncbi:MAG: flippase-like domain-containing protein [Bacteroidales bacterium]|nr:flippase-like domain-containing protein [Bacteroidales bacterium]